MLALRRALLSSSSTVLILYGVLALIRAVLKLVREATCSVHLIKEERISLTRASKNRAKYDRTAIGKNRERFEEQRISHWTAGRSHSAEGYIRLHSVSGRNITGLT